MVGVAVLTLGIHGVRVLDVGAGPAPSLYAIDDFYQALNEYARVAGVHELQLPSTRLDCIERSQTMVAFFHHFSEFCGRPGPFGPVFSDFAGLNLRDAREWHRRQNEVETCWDPETQEYEEFYNPDAAAEPDGLFRYRMVVFSNFLTLELEVGKFEAELRRLFRDLRPGAVVIVIGARGNPYPQIYERVAAVAKEEGLTQADWHTDNLGRIGHEDDAARLINQAQHRLYRYLEQAVGADALVKSSAWPDYWTSMPSPQARPRFGLRIFRRGRWPKR